MALKNLWSLNVDELLVADELKNNFKKKNNEVLFPLNAQMKDIDLVILNLRNNKIKTIQIKGSRTYQPQRWEREKYGKGSTAWLKMNKKSIFNAANKVDFYVFVLHGFVDGQIKKEIKIDFLVFPIKDFYKICKKKKVRKEGNYFFSIWIDIQDYRVFDFNNTKGKEIILSKYLNNWDLIK